MGFKSLAVWLTFVWENGPMVGDSVMPQNPLQGHDSHFTPQARRLKVKTIQTFIL